MLFDSYYCGFKNNKLFKMAKKKYKTGLVLSGGGTRGFAHIGALQALNDNGIFPDIVSGVSAGSIVGALYCDGKKPSKILNILTKHKMFHYLEFTIPKQGLVEMTGFEKSLKSELEAMFFEDLEIPLLTFAVNINKAKLVKFDKGDLVKAVIASSSIPVLFPPVEIDDTSYLDGGIIDNFPIGPLEGICDEIIGVNVNPIGYEKNFTNLLKIAERTFHISIRTRIIERSDRCSLFIEPKGLDKFSLMDISSGNEIYKLGYKETLKVLREKKRIKKQ